MYRMKTNYLFALAFFLSGFNYLSAQENIPKHPPTQQKVEIKQFEDFGFSIGIAADWFIQDEADHLAWMDKGKKMMAGDNEKLIDRIEKAETNISYLLTVFKYPLDSFDSYNPSMTIVAENLNKLTEIKDTEQYLAYQKQLLEQSQPNFNIKGGFALKRINGQRFYSLQSMIRYGGEYIHQIYYTSIHKRQALSFIISYVSEEDQAELEKMLRSAIFR